MQMKRFAATAAFLATGTLLALTVHGGVLRPAVAAAQEGAVRPISITVFRGDLGESGIGLGSWGSGGAESSKEAILIGNSSIRVTTQGLYQGARLDFRNGVDLAQAFQNPRAYLRMQVRFTGSRASQNVFTGGGGPNIAGGPPPDFVGGPGGGPPPGFGGFPGGGVETTRRAASPFNKMRFVLVMGDGSRYELVRPVDVPPTEDPDSYVPLSFPIAAITKKVGAGKPAPSGQGAVLKQLAVFGDRPEQFYIGEIGVITDETDITVEPLEEQIYFANQQTLFVADAQGGATSLRYSWDFDASDGIQEDAQGRVAVRVFPRSGDDKGLKKYTVTLTVSDHDGLKKPVSTTQEIEVSD